MVYVTFLPLSMRHQATVRDVPDLTYFTSPLLEQTHSYTSGAAAWNQLTEEQVTVNSLQSFKKLLH